jgi:hypothetical protein
VRILGYRPDRDLSALYEGARLVVFPSLYGGFGMPILEAMHFGRPVACSDVTSLPEVAGDAALFFDPRRPESIVDALLRLLDEPGLAEALARRGQARLSALDTADMARRYLEVFEAAAGPAQPRVPTLDGVFPDRWLGGRLALSLAEGGTCELDLFAPPWLRARRVQVEAVARGRRLGGCRLERGARETLRFEVPGRDPSVEIRLSPLFQPAAIGLGDDHRVLSCQCEGARLLGPEGVHDLVPATGVPATP